MIYNFNTEVIVTESNVLAYASHDFDLNDGEKNTNHNVMIQKIGNGISKYMNKIKQESLNK